MTNVIVTISGININNEETVQDILGHAGYKGSGKRIDMETIVLELGTIEERDAAGIAQSEIINMLGSLVLHTSCKINSNLKGE